MMESQLPKAQNHQNRGQNRLQVYKYTCNVYIINLQCILASLSEGWAGNLGYPRNSCTHHEKLFPFGYIFENKKKHETLSGYRIRGRRGLTLSNHQTEPYNKLHNLNQQPETIWYPGDSSRALFIPKRWRSQKTFKRVTNHHPQKGHKELPGSYVLPFLELACSNTLLVEKTIQNKGRSQTKNRWCHSDPQTQNSETRSSLVPHVLISDHRPHWTLISCLVILSTKDPDSSEVAAAHGLQSQTSWICLSLVIV